LRSFFIILSYLPNLIISIFAHLLKVAIYIFARRDRKIFFRNMDRVYGLPKHSQFTKLFFRQCVHHQVRCQVETVTGIYRPARLHVEGVEDLGDKAKELLSQGRGLIVITAHLGSWEFVAKYTGIATGKTFHALAKPAPFQFLTSFLDDMRGRMNTVVLWTGRSSLLKDMIKTVRSGEILGFVMDQKPANRKGPRVDFLGQPTEFVTGPANLALKCSTPVLAVYCLRMGPWRFRVISEPLFDPKAETSETTDSLTQRFAAHLSATIHSFPDQWTWSYKRWSDLPKSAIIHE
jgi:KDO2-lipid IV(A) lauroyltransferase